MQAQRRKASTLAAQCEAGYNNHKETAATLASAPKRDVAPGVFVNNAEDAKKGIEQGFKYMLFTNDQSLLLQYLKTIVAGVGLKR